MNESAETVDDALTGALPPDNRDQDGLFIRIHRFWQRTFRPVRVRGQQTLDIQSERSVVVEEGAVLAGSIIAPYITVSGLVYGYLVAREVVVKKQGQVWGDVYASTVTFRPGGVVHGWCSTPDETTLIALANA